MLTDKDIAAYFTRKDGTYLCARWGRPIAPIVFGVDDGTLNIFKGAVEALSALTQHPLAETDFELGVNLMFFMFKSWDELSDLPDLDRLVPELDQLVPKLKSQGASQYRLFRFDDQGAIQACFVFICMDGPLADWPAESLALVQASQAFLLWGDQAFAERSPLARLPNGADILRPDVGDILRAAYAPELPHVAHDASFSLRLFARVSGAQAG